MIADAPQQSARSSRTSTCDSTGRPATRQVALPLFDEEMGAAVGAGFASADAMLMGRVLYDEWAAYWPEHAHEPFGDVMNSIKK
jgi:hypothetical protein